MYEFHYKYIRVKYGIGAKLQFTDTDNSVCEIQTDDVYQDFYEGRSLFDFRNHPEDGQFYDPVNKNVIAKIKDEVRGKIINEFFRLK